MKLKGRLGTFYGWWLVVMAYPLMGLPIGFVSFGFSFFIQPLRHEFGWSVTKIVIVFSLGHLQGGLISPIVGFSIDRWGARRTILLGQLLTGLGLMLTSQTQELWQLYAFMLIAIAGSELGAFSPLTAVLVRWFVRKRGRAMGFVTPAGSIGQLLLPAVAVLITLLGWREALLVMGLMVWAIGLPLGALVRNDPYDYGLRPDGNSPEAADREATQRPTEAEVPVTLQGIRWRQAIRLQPFWMLGLAMSLNGAYHGSIRVFLIPHIEALGYSREVAGTLLLVFFFISLPARIAFGWLADYGGAKKLFVAVILLQVAGLVALAMSTQLWHLFVYALAYESAVGGFLVMQTVIIADYFGVANFASIRGLMQAMGVVGGFAGPIAGALVFDATDSYSPSFWALAVVAAVAVPLVVAARRLDPNLEPATSPMG